MGVYFLINFQIFDNYTPLTGDMEDIIIEQHLRSLQ